MEARKTASERSPYDKVSRHGDLGYGDEEEEDEVHVAMEPTVSLFDKHTDKQQPESKTR